MNLKSLALKTVLSVTAVVVTLVNIVFFGIDNSFHSLNNLPEGEIVDTTAATNLDRPYVVTFYRVDGGKNLGTCFRAEVKELETGKTYNVYWEKKTENGPTGIVYSWVNDTTMIINDRTVELTENGLHYDFRKTELNPFTMNT